MFQLIYPLNIISQPLLVKLSQSAYRTVLHTQKNNNYGLQNMYEAAHKFNFFYKPTLMVDYKQRYFFNSPRYTKSVMYKIFSFAIINASTNVVCVV